ncbi:MAG TPA: YdcF family protein [Pyrinomonadaceae bacterium]
MKKAKSEKGSSRRFRILSVILLLFLAWIFLAPFLAESLIVEKPLKRADAILILGGSATFTERTQKAAELYRQGISERILLTDDGGQAGWSQAEQRNPKFVELARKSLIEQGVSPTAIEILPSPVAGTIDEARALAEKAGAENLKSVLLVTSAYHTRRALWTFRKVSIENNVEIGIESARTGIQTPAPFSWWLSVAGWNLVAGEYVKSAYYRVYY